MPPQCGAGRASIRKCPPDADGADGVQFIRIRKHLCFERRGLRLVPEPVGFDRVSDRVDKRRRLACEDFARPLCTQQVMAFPINALRYIVQQSGGPDDGEVRALRLRDPLAERRHPQHVVEVMPPAARFV